MRGRVQGVGFRPSLYRLAGAHRLVGTIVNSAEGVVADLEGEGADLEAFERALPAAIPRRAVLDHLSGESLDPVGRDRLEILESQDSGGRGARIPGDLATCGACLAEVAIPTDRRHRYAFTNCTDCGPRFTIAEAIPYDRARTSMRRFPMCEACGREYRDPLDRRYHAEPIACPSCGPALRLLDGAGRPLGGDPVEGAVALLRGGRVVAVKGLGGFHLAVDARSSAAVEELRRRKGREAKPLAVMVRDLDEARRHAEVGAAEAELLSGPAAPIVLCPKLATSGLAAEVAPANPTLGLMLPYTPLHHLLLEGIAAIVLTSGNLSEEPIARENEEARTRLAGIADAFLEHDREILVSCDDSVVATTPAGPLVVRRSRGLVPDPIRLPLPAGRLLATGGQLKNVFCLTLGDEAYLGPHVGDLDRLESYEHFLRSLAHLERLLRITPEAVAHDAHPDYITTRFAEELGLPARAVQHHHAHAASVVADLGLEAPLLALALDGTGYGEDGTIWGGEILLLEELHRARRVGHLRPFPLPGGDASIRRPRRTAVALLLSACGPSALEEAASFLGVSAEERSAVEAMVQRGVGLVETSSCGRLFDAVAALLGLGRQVTYEGQPAMELENAAWGQGEVPPLPFGVAEDPARGGAVVVDHAPALAALLAGLRRGEPVAALAAGFHAGLARALADAAVLAARRAGVSGVVLSGGCFQNRRLLGELIPRLEGAGLVPHLPRRVPVNDGGLALGQAAVLASALRAGEVSRDNAKEEPCASASP
jgi:hydrogenase maturation protein HypF